MDARSHPPSPDEPSPALQPQHHRHHPHQHQHQHHHHPHPHPQQPDEPRHESPLSPPYWKLDARNHSPSSNTTADPHHRPAILLEDNELTGTESSSALWARHCSVSDYVVVAGNAPAALASYVVWNCKIDTLDGGPIHLRKRYSEFDRLRRHLVRAFPHAEAAIPPLPPKSLITKFKPQFLEKRRLGLAFFLNCVLLNPDFAGSPVLKEFLFS